MLRSSLALSFCLSSLLVATPATAHQLVSRANWIRVVRVHHCEGVAWDSRGPIYSGGLGWLSATWHQYKAPWMPATMDLATPQEQAWAMVRFVATTLHYWPDQQWPARCSGGY